MPTKFDFVRYDFVLYKVDFSERRLIPKGPGIYILFEKSFLYCGGAKNIRKRVRESRQAQNFGEKVFFFPIGPFRVFEGYPIKLLIKALENACIAALHTIIYGNGLPLTLTNQQNVVLLPDSAWSDDITPEYELGIHIAQTVLYSIGLPRAMIHLPFLPFAIAGGGRLIADFNATRWPAIYAAERAARQNPNHPRSPMFVVHPGLQ